MKRLLALLFLLASTPALAGSSTIAVTPGSGATYGVGTDGSSNFFARSSICDGAACALIASVNGAGTTGTNGLAIQGMTGGVAVPGSGTFWQATQPISGTITANQGGTWNVNEGGTWTVQPGNTANTTAWLVTGTGGVFPATQSGTWNVTNISGTVSLP